MYVRVAADGGFAVSGDPQRMLPAQDIELRLQVSAPGYAQVSALETFTAADLARVPRSLLVAGRTHETLVTMPCLARATSSCRLCR